MRDCTGRHLMVGQLILEIQPQCHFIHLGFIVGQTEKNLKVVGTYSAVTIPVLVKPKYALIISVEEVEKIIEEKLEMISEMVSAREWQEVLEKYVEFSNQNVNG